MDILWNCVFVWTCNVLLRYFSTLSYRFVLRNVFFFYSLYLRIHRLVVHKKRKLCIFSLHGLKSFYISTPEIYIFFPKKPSSILPTVFLVFELQQPYLYYNKSCRVYSVNNNNDLSPVAMYNPLRWFTRF